MSKNLTYNLEYIGNNNKTINNYIITDDKSTVESQDGLGNIIIYTSLNSSGAVENDLYKERYNDLYIGDEHIAGGFGFKNISDREYTYSYTIQNYNEINNIYEELNISYTYISDIYNKINDLSKAQINVDKSRNYFYSDDSKYVLEINNNTNELYINNVTSFNISEIKLYFDIYIKLNNNYKLISNDNFISLRVNSEISIPNNYFIKLTKIVYTFEHTFPITSWTLSYKEIDTYNPNAVSYDQINILKSNDGTDININDSIEEIYNIYEYTVDETIYGNLYYGQYTIKFDDNIGNYEIFGNDEIKDIQFIFSLYDNNNDSVNIILPKINFVSPIYYNAIDDINDDLSFNDFINRQIIPNNDKIELNYDFLYDYKLYYYCVLVPLYIIPDVNKVSFTFNKQIQTTIQWNLTNKTYNINNIIYVLYCTEHQYKGNANWIMNIK